MKKLFILVAIVFILLPAISAKEGHLPLLAVKDTKDGYQGAVADLYLEIQEGSGRVFLDTFPLTKADTQISTRFGKEIACNYLNKDCENYDFIYTIRADSSIIAGPSAGGAITMLTISLLEGIELNEDIGMTGTINSGGIIGSVGGVKQKIDAAKQAGLKKVLIPKGERFIQEDKKIIETTTIYQNDTPVLRNATIRNKTIDLVEYGKEKGIEVVEVSDIGEALFEFTGIMFEKENHSVQIDESYEKTMKGLAFDLCNRTEKLKKQVEKSYREEYNSSMSSILNLTQKAETAMDSGKYYAVASYCFGSNVQLTHLMLLLNNASEKDVARNLGLIEDNIEKLGNIIEKKQKTTITDLEAYMVVKERLIEAEDYADDVYKDNSTEPDLYKLAYSFERVYSAFSWYSFFDHRGNKFVFDKESLKKSCQNKIAEADERYQYVLLFYPILELKGTRREIDYAYEDFENENYELCLFKATKAKAESDIILSASGIGEGEIDGLVDKKIEVAEKNTAKQIEKGNFPILAYSYYEYARDLKDTDKYSSLLYAEYALELSNLEIYFKEVKSVPTIDIDLWPFLYALIGMVAGIAIGFIIGKHPKKKKRR